MNQKATYELTITEKLEQLTAPDKVDAIWARIEAQLDIDLPTDDGTADPPAPPTSGLRKWINRGFIIAAVAIVLTYFFNNRKQRAISNNQPTITAPATPMPNENPVRNNSPGNRNTVTQENKQGGENATISIADSDTVTPVKGPVQLQSDSNAVNSNVPQVLYPPLVIPQKNPPPDSTKKGRGVKGITDSDYKIVPKKDSTKP